MKFGIKLGNLDRFPLPEGVGRLAVAAEECGFDSAWVADHIVFPIEHALDQEHQRNDMLPTGQHGEALTCLAYVAGRTKRIHLGTSVMVMPLRNPLLGAKMLSTLDVLAGGRVIVGIGIGWLAAEFEALGAPKFDKRGRVTDEWIKIMRLCWTQAEPSFEGEHYRFAPLHFSPRPSRPIPILVGGNSEPALRRAGVLGDGWHGTRVGIAELGRSVAMVKQAAEDCGRDPARLTFALGMEIDIVDEGSSLNAAGMLAPERALVGRPHQIIDSIRKIEAAGVQHLELRFRPMRDVAATSINPTVQMMQQFGQEIMPHFRK